MNIYSHLSNIRPQLSLFLPSFVYVAIVTEGNAMEKGVRTKIKWCFILITTLSLLFCESNPYMDRIPLGIGDQKYCMNDRQPWIRLSSLLEFILIIFHLL